MARASSITSVFAGVLCLVGSGMFVAACGSDEADPEDLVAACESYCEAQAAPGCANGQPADQCAAQCAYLPTALDGQCIAEYTAALECASGLEFTCMNDFPQPQPTDCLNEAQALVTCQQDAPCKTYCKAAVAAGCGGASEDACLSTCKAEAEKQDFCDNDLLDLRECEGKQALSCVGGKPHTDQCADEKSQFADCLGFDDECAGFCFLADDAGCSGGGMDACITACQATRNSMSSCESDYRQYLQCAIDNGVSCNGSDATASACTSEKQAYDTCAMGPTP